MLISSFRQLFANCKDNPFINGCLLILFFFRSLPQKAVFVYLGAKFFGEGAVGVFKGGKAYRRKIAAFAPGFERAPYLVPACIASVQLVFVADGALVGGRKICAPQFFAFLKNGARFARKR